MSTWKGISHARMTRSMQGLRGGEYKVLAAVRRLIPDGQRRKLSQALIARKAAVSEGTVSAAMKQLDGLYLKRHYLGRGRGNGYEIEMLPPTEQQLALPLEAPAKGSNSDPSDRSFLSGVPEPQTPPQKGSDSDPSLFYDHAHEQQQRGGPESEVADSSDPPQLAPETIAALKAANAHEKLIARVARDNPACTPADVAAELAAAELKAATGYSHTPPGLALEALARRQTVVPPRASSGEAAAPAKKPRGRAAPPRDEPVDNNEIARWLDQQGVPYARDGHERRPAEPWRGPTPYYGAAPPSERVAVFDPPERPPPSERRRGGP